MLIKEGLVYTAIDEVGGYAGSFVTDPSSVEQKMQYNWYIDALTWNSDSIYQREIVINLAGMLENWDPNASANLFYNYTLLYPDSEDNAYAWQFIDEIRHGQRINNEDTTPFTVLAWPLQKLAVPAAAIPSVQPCASSSLALGPNPASSELDVKYTLAHGGQTLLVIYNVTGNIERAIVNGPRASGPNEASVSIADLPSGHYFVRLASCGDVITKELVVQH